MSGPIPECSTLPFGKWLVREPPTLSLVDHALHPSAVGQLARRVAVVKLGQVAGQVPGRDGVVSAVDAALQLREVVLDLVRRHHHAWLVAHELVLGVVYGPVCQELGPQTDVPPVPRRC